MKYILGTDELANIVLFTPLNFYLITLVTTESPDQDQK